MPATIEIPQEVFEQWKREYLATQLHLETSSIIDAYAQWVLGFLGLNRDKVEVISQRMDEEIGDKPDEEAIFFKTQITDIDLIVARSAVHLYRFARARKEI